jgi:hypothetical protein
LPPVNQAISLLVRNSTRSGCSSARSIKKRSASRARSIIFSVRKLLTFAKTGDCRSELAAEFARFQAEVWDVFNRYEIAGYLTTLKAFSSSCRSI